MGGGKRDFFTIAKGARDTKNIFAAQRSGLIECRFHPMNTIPPVLLKKGHWLPLAGIAEGLQRHEITLEDLYFDTRRKIWAPLGSHPEIKSQLLPTTNSLRAVHTVAPVLLKKGAWLSLPRIVEGLRRHEIALGDFYFDTARKAWSTLNSHPEIKKHLLPIPKILLRSVPVARATASHGPRRADQ